MKVKKFLTAFSFTILFAVISILSLISYIFSLSFYDLFAAIMTAVVSIFFMVLTIIDNYYNSYCKCQHEIDPHYWFKIDPL